MTSKKQGLPDETIRLYTDVENVIVSPALYSDAVSMACEIQRLREALRALAMQSPVETPAEPAPNVLRGAFDKELNDAVYTVAKLIQEECAVDPAMPKRGLANHAAMAERVLRAVVPKWRCSCTSSRPDGVMTWTIDPQCGVHGAAVAPYETTPEAMATFEDYFVRNYPGPNTIISNPKWHAPKIFRAALYAIKLAQSSVKTAEEPPTTECAKRFRMDGDGYPVEDPNGDWVKYDDLVRLARVAMSHVDTMVETVRDAPAPPNLDRYAEQYLTEEDIADRHEEQRVRHFAQWLATK